jgi:hypothetical protein
MGRATPDPPKGGRQQGVGVPPRYFAAVRNTAVGLAAHIRVCFLRLQSFADLRAPPQDYFPALIAAWAAARRAMGTRKGEQET